MKFTDEPIESSQPLQMKAEETTSTKALRNVRKVAGALLDAITEKDTEEEQHERQRANGKIAPQPRQQPANEP